MPKLLIASQNQGKLIEIQTLLADHDIDLILPNQIGLDLDAKEDGHTYAENASKKAKAFAQASGLITLADDTGLEVDALDGQPGLYSARFAPQPGATDADRRRHLLEKLALHPRPWTARFRCVVALYHPTGELCIADGICPGEIIPEERGQQGFGYDRIFLVKTTQFTLAEMNLAEKNRVSHRGLAVNSIRPDLIRMINS